jgi:phosphatidylserine decarboxylase
MNTNAVAERLGNCESSQIICELYSKLNEDPALKDSLICSLVSAKSIGSSQLDHLLYEALQWPVNEVEYLDYLTNFARWIPHPDNSPAWKDKGNPQHDEIYDRLCHFNFLIDQGDVLRNNWFNDWNTRYSQAWGSFLDTSASFSQAILEDFITNAPLYEVNNSMISDDGLAPRPNNPSGWLTFNQFFARELNPGLHPITQRADNRIACCPADCTFRAWYPIGEDSKIPQITLKNTHRFGSIPELLMGDKYSKVLGEPFAEVFAGGTFVHYFLGPYSYHRFHAPVSGLVQRSYQIQGRTYLNVRVTDHQFDAPDSSEDGYEFRQARGVIIFDTSQSEDGDVGLVAVLPIGMTHVSSVNMMAQPRTNMVKGEEFGYFMFGGSDIIVLFQRGRVDDLDKGTNYRRYGEQIATLLHSA